MKLFDSIENGINFLKKLNGFETNEWFLGGGFVRTPQGGKIYIRAFNYDEGFGIWEEYPGLSWSVSPGGQWRGFKYFKDNQQITTHNARSKPRGRLK